MKSHHYHSFLLCLTALTMAACAPQLRMVSSSPDSGQARAATTPAAAIQPPRFRPFSDGNYWVMLDPLPYHIDSTGQHGVVPAGLVTNFASIPSVAQCIYKPYGNHGRPAIVHDYLYWTQPGTRRDADAAFYELMKKNGVHPLKRNIMYTLTRWFAARNWTRSTEQRRRGMRWVIPEEEIEHIPGNISWFDYREEMLRKNPAKKAE